MIFVPGRLSVDLLDALIREASDIGDIGQRIAFLSGRFRGTPYRESTLPGGANEHEVLTINLEGVDCFTFVDYVEAMRRSASFTEFAANLRKVRYRRSEVSFGTRNHFFTDWREFNRAFVDDATERVGGEKAIKTLKVLNRKEDGTLFVEGIRPEERIVAYIPRAAISDEVVERLQTGDYAGIYTSAQGLDVSHVGIIVREGEAVFLRHASSLRRSVVDEDLRKYVRDKPGLIVLRPR